MLPKIKDLPPGFESHGHWSENNVLISWMYKDTKTGEMYYDDVEQARDRGLRILRPAGLSDKDTE
jgi:hypothetical protein